MITNTEKTYLDQIFDEQEQTHLANFWKNETLREAVRKVLLFVIYRSGTLEKGKKAEPLRNFVLGFASLRDKLTDEEMGQKLRAIIEALDLLEKGFEYLSTYQQEITEERSSDNPAR